MADGDLHVEGAAPAPANSPAPAAAPVAEAAPPAANTVSDVGAGAKPAEVAPDTGTHGKPTLLELASDKLSEPVKPVEKGADEKALEPAKQAEKPAEKGDDKKPVEAAKPEEAAPAEPEKPVEYTYEFPEHVKPDEKILGEWNDIARAVKMTPEQARASVGIFNKAAEAFVKQQQQNQVDVWNKLQDKWILDAKSDPAMGGSNWPVFEKAMARGRDAIISDAKPGSPRYEREAAEFNEALRITGAGNNPAIMRAFRNAARFSDEPRALTEQPKPSPNNGAKPSRSLYSAPKAPPGTAQ